MRTVFVLAGAAVLAAGIGLPAQAPPAGAATAISVQHAVQGVQAAMAALNPGSLRMNGDAKQALLNSQLSIQRNLSDAMPDLLSAFRAAPENLAAAFRLYRDLDVVLAVAQSSSDAMPPNQQTQAATALAASVTEMNSSLNQLGDWIESLGQAEYTRLHQPPPVASPAAKPAPAPVTPPSTLIINNANGGR